MTKLVGSASIPGHIRTLVHTLSFKHVHVTLIRVAPRRFDDDNWQAAAKPIRDGVADIFGHRDDLPDVWWFYDQRRGQPKEYAVQIVVEVQL